MGPGQYKTESRAKTVLGATSNFKSAGRKEVFNSLSADLPGPGEYYSNKEVKVKVSEAQAFG